MMIPRSPSELTRQAKLNGAPPSAGPEGNKSQSVSPNDRTVFRMTTPTRPVFHRGFNYAILFPKSCRHDRKLRDEFGRTSGFSALVRRDFLFFFEWIIAPNCHRLCVNLVVSSRVIRRGRTNGPTKRKVSNEQPRRGPCHN